jgi:hypothetical protein
MALNRKTIDTDAIYIREVFARGPLNQTIPAGQILISNGDDSTRWDYLRPSTFHTVIGGDGVAIQADQNLSSLRIRTSGPLISSYADIAANALIIKSSPPILRFPTIGKDISEYASVKFTGVGDVLVSTVTSGVTPSVFLSISSFTSAGYSTISGEVYAWRPYIYSVLSTSQALTSFVSSIPTSWPTGLQNISTAEAYPNYTTGDAYFSGVSINMRNYIGYIKPGATKVLLEVEPSYLLPSFHLGNEIYPTLLKNISSYIQYNGTSTFIVNGSENTDTILSQQSAGSNYFNKPMKLPIDSGIIASNWAIDGASGYYTLYHRIPGGMANLNPGGPCGCYTIGVRGGMDMKAPTYVNATSALMGIYNTMPLLSTPQQIAQQNLISVAPSGLTIVSTTQTSVTISWQGAVRAASYILKVNGIATAATIAGSSAEITGLSPGQIYSVVVIALSNTGVQSPSDFLYVNTAPLAPHDVVISAVTTTGFTLTWYNFTGANSYTYKINDQVSAPLYETGNSATFSGLQPNGYYSISITSVNNGGSDTTTQGILAITAPAAAFHFTSVVDRTTVLLNWQGAAGVISYSFLVNGKPAFPTMPSGYSALFTGLHPNTQYNFNVIVIGAGGRTPSDTYSVVTL